MKAKLPPLIVTPRRPPEPAPQVHPHHAPRTQHVSRKNVSKAGVAEKAPPPSTEESRTDGQSFREALFGGGGPDAAQNPGLVVGGFGEGAGGQQGQGGGGQQDKGRDSRKRSPSIEAAERNRGSGSARGAEGVPGDPLAVDEGWMELEIESRVAGKIRLSVLRETGRLRAKLTVGNPAAAQWLQEHLATVEQELAADLGCVVRLEMS